VHSTEEVLEQHRAIGGGEDGGKAPGQGETRSATHAPGTGPGQRVPRARARRHHLVSPGDIISESAGDFVGIRTHRGWKPTEDDIDHLMGALENFLERAFVIKHNLRRVKKVIPARGGH
jgi:hypothetical protein